MDRAGELTHSGWAANLLAAGGLEPGERVLVVVDEWLAEAGAQLAAAVRDAGGQPRLELWAADERPMAHAPAGVLAGARLNRAVRPRGHVMLDEKAGGTAHVAIGRNTGPYHGDNEASIHVDMVFSAPELEVDGRPVALP
jgi:aminopeptidase